MENQKIWIKNLEVVENCVTFVLPWEIAFRV